MRREWLVQFQASGLSVEKLLNAARLQGIRLRSVKREKNRALTIRCAPKAYAAFSALAREKGYQVSPAQPVGALRLSKRLIRRAGLWAGAAAGVLLLVWALGYVWEVRVENAGAYAGEVRLFLEEMGIRPGIRRSSVSLGELRDKLEWRLPRVKWVRAEWAGVALRVRLEEGVPPPQIADAGESGSVVAAEDGVIRRLTTFAGTPAVKEGDFVKAGQVLIKGEERGKDGAVVPVKARGEAIARLWFSVRVRMPVTELISEPTGRSAERRILRTPFFSWCGQEEPAYLTADRQRQDVALGGAWAPVWLTRESIREAALRREERNLEEVKREGARAAVFHLNQALIGDEIVDKWINFSMMEGDTITVTATAEILREIGRGPSP